jgi:hypothetical protein
MTRKSHGGKADRRRMRATLEVSRVRQDMALPNVVISVELRRWRAHRLQSSSKCVRQRSQRSRAPVRIFLDSDGASQAFDVAA